jgi:hypothetical protein
VQLELRTGCKILQVHTQGQQDRVYRLFLGVGGVCILVAVWKNIAQILCKHNLAEEGIAPPTQKGLLDNIMYSVYLQKDLRHLLERLLYMRACEYNHDFCTHCLLGQ